MLATEYAEYYKIKAQGKNESDLVFRQRVATALRKMGHIVEAHEALQDSRYDQDENVMTGILGAVAQALHNTSYGGDPVGNDIAAGTIARHQISPEGQRERKSKEILANLLTGGMSPDDIKSLLG